MFIKEKKWEKKTTGMMNKKKFYNFFFYCILKIGDSDGDQRKVRKITIYKRY